MKIYIIHGWDGSPDEPMLKHIKKEAESLRHKVTILEMPEPAVPTISAWMNTIDDSVKPDKDTVFIGHSIGCQAILRYLETITTPIRAIILIAPWMTLDEEALRKEGEEMLEIAGPWVNTPINWELVKKNAGKVICLFSDNDPYVPLSNADTFRDNLNAKIIIEKDKGHFSEDTGVKSNRTVIEELRDL